MPELRRGPIADRWVIIATDKPNTPGWRVRVVPNKFPALEAYDELRRAGIGFFDRMRGVGAHEVVIEMPDHHMELADLPLEQVRLAIEAYIQRMCELMDNLEILPRLTRAAGFEWGTRALHQPRASGGLIAAEVAPFAFS